MSYTSLFSLPFPFSVPIGSDPFIDCWTLGEKQKIQDTLNTLNKIVKYSLIFFSPPLGLILVSLAHRVHCEGALHLALLTSVPSVKWFHLILQLGRPCAESLHRTLQDANSAPCAKMLHPAF